MPCCTDKHTHTHSRAAGWFGAAKVHDSAGAGMWASPSGCLLCLADLPVRHHDYPTRCHALPQQITAAAKGLRGVWSCKFPGIFCLCDAGTSNMTAAPYLVMHFCAGYDTHGRHRDGYENGFDKYGYDEHGEQWN